MAVCGWGSPRRLDVVARKAAKAEAGNTLAGDPLRSFFFLFPIRSVFFFTTAMQATPV